MTIILTEHQEQLWDAGWEDARHIEDDLVEQIDRQRITEPVVVERIDGTVAFAVTPPRHRR